MMRTGTQLLVVVVLPLIGCTSTMRQSAWSGHAPSFDDTPIAFDVRGSGDPALVFVHGWCCNRGHFSAQMDALEKEHRVVALDLGGHGQSGTDRKTWHIRDLARDVEAVVDHLNLAHVILVGHSMGGPVSLQAAARMPDRVIAVVGIDTLHNVELVMSDAMRKRFVDAFDDDPEGQMTRFVRGAMPQGTSEELVARITREAIATPKNVAVELIQSTADFNQKDAMAACPVPVVCINAAKPRATNVEANRRHAKSFDVMLMQGVGHFPMLEAPDRFNELLKQQIAILKSNH